MTPAAVRAVFPAAHFAVKLTPVNPTARALEAGFDRHVTKPFDVSALEAFIATLGPRAA